MHGDHSSVIFVEISEIFGTHDALFLGTEQLRTSFKASFENIQWGWGWLEVGILYSMFLVFNHRVHTFLVQKNWGENTRISNNGILVLFARPLPDEILKSLVKP